MRYAKLKYGLVPELKRMGTAEVTESQGVNMPRDFLLVTIDVPPSTNNLFATVRGRRVKSKNYREWIAKVVPVLRTLKPVSGPCRVNVTIDGEVNRRRDGDNFIKPIHDALVESGAIPGDSLKYVREGWWRYRESAGPPTVTVWIVSIEE